MARRRAPIKFKWRYTRTRGWEGRRDGEKLIRPEYGYPAYAFLLQLHAVSWIERRHWRWSVVRNYELDGNLYEEQVAHGEVEFGDDVGAAQERAMREAEEAYLTFARGA